MAFIWRMRKRIEESHWPREVFFASDDLKYVGDIELMSWGTHKSWVIYFLTWPESFEICPRRKTKFSFGIIWSLLKFQLNKVKNNFFSTSSLNQIIFLDFFAKLTDVISRRASIKVHFVSCQDHCYVSTAFKRKIKVQFYQRLLVWRSDSRPTQCYSFVCIERTTQTPLQCFAQIHARMR